MEEIDSSGSAERTIAQQASTLHLIVQALLFTGILYLTAGLPLPNITENAFSSSAKPTASLWQSVTNAVLQDVSYHSGLPRSTLRIVQAHQYIWPDDCLGIDNLGIVCDKTQVPGWQVTVVSGEKRWIYRTNASGSVVKLDTSTAASAERSGA